MGRQVVVVFTGLPGTGKSTMADLVARALGAPAFCGDWFLGALMPAHHVLAQLDRADFLEMYRNLLQSLIVRQGLLQQCAVVDCLVPDEVLTSWGAAAARQGSGFCVVECVCSDEQLHRRRVEGRVRDIPGWHEVGWSHVQRMRTEIAPLTHPRISIDAVHPVDVNLTRVKEYLGHTGNSL